MGGTSISEASWQMPKQHRRVVVMQSEYGASSRPYLWRILERVGCMKSARKTGRSVRASEAQLVQATQTALSEGRARTLRVLRSLGEHLRNARQLCH